MEMTLKNKGLRYFDIEKQDTLDDVIPL